MKLWVTWLFTVLPMAGKGLKIYSLYSSKEIFGSEWGTIHRLPYIQYKIGRHVVLVAQLVCWTMQFIGHGIFEKRAPALLDNLVQAFLMAPFFVLLEILHTFGGYEPYPGFHDKVSKLIEEARKEWEDNKSKKSS